MGAKWLAMFRFGSVNLCLWSGGLSVGALIAALSIHPEHSGSWSEWALVGLFVIFGLLFVVSLIGAIVEARRLKARKRGQVQFRTPWHLRWNDEHTLWLTVSFIIFGNYHFYNREIMVALDGRAVSPQEERHTSNRDGSHIYEYSIDMTTFGEYSGSMIVGLIATAGEDDAVSNSCSRELPIPPNQFLQQVQQTAKPQPTQGE